MAESESYDLSDSPEDGGYDNPIESAANADDTFGDVEQSTNGESVGITRYRRKRIGGPPTGPAAAAQRRRPAAAAAAAAASAAGSKTRSAKNKGIVKLRPSQSLEAIDQPYVGEEIEGKLFCVCRQLYDPTKFMIGCDNCDDWFHARCVNITPTEAQKIVKFVCPNCRKREQHAKRAALNASTIKAAKRKHMDKTVVELTEKGRPKRMGKDSSANAQSLLSQWNQLLKEEWEEEEKRAKDKELVPADNYSDVDEEDILNGNIEEESDLYLTSDEEADADETDYWDIARSVGMDTQELHEYLKAKEAAGELDIQSESESDNEERRAETAEPASNGASTSSESAVPSHPLSAARTPTIPSSALGAASSNDDSQEPVPMEATAGGVTAVAAEAAGDVEMTQPNGLHAAEDEDEAVEDSVKEEPSDAKQPLEATANAGDSAGQQPSQRVSTRSSMKKEAKAKRDELSLGLGLSADPEEADEDSEEAQRPIGGKRRRLLPLVIAESSQGDMGTPEMYKLPRRERDLALLAFLRSRRVKIQTELVRLEVEFRKLQAGLDFAHRLMLTQSFAADNATPPVYDTLASVPFSDVKEQWREVLPCRACSGLIPIKQYTAHLVECAASLANAPGSRFCSLPQSIAHYQRTHTSESVICGCPLGRVPFIYRSKSSQSLPAPPFAPHSEAAASSDPSASPPTSLPSSSASLPASSSPPVASSSSSAAPQYCTRPRAACVDHPLWEVLWEADITRKRAVQRRRLDLVNNEMSIVAERILERSEKESVDVVPAHPPEVVSLAPFTSNGAHRAPAPGTRQALTQHIGAQRLPPTIGFPAYSGATRSAPHGLQPHVPTVPAYAMATMSFMHMDAAGAIHSDPRFHALAQMHGEDPYLQARSAASPHEHYAASAEEGGSAPESQAELRERQRRFEHDVKMLREYMGSQPFPMARGAPANEEERRMFLMQNHYQLMMMQHHQQLMQHQQRQQFNYYHHQQQQHQFYQQQQQHFAQQQHHHQQQQQMQQASHSPRSQGQPALEAIEPNGASSTEHSAASEATASSSSPSYGPANTSDTGRAEPKAEPGTSAQKKAPQLSDTQIDALVKRVHNIPTPSVYSKPISTTVSSANNLTITVSQSNPPKPTTPQDPARKPAPAPTTNNHANAHVPNRITTPGRPAASVLPRNYSTPGRSASRSPVTVSPAVLYPHNGPSSSSPSNGQRPAPPGTR